MGSWLDFNLEHTIRDYEYTKKSVQNMNIVLDSKEFEGQEAKQIYEYLVDKMEIVSFGDYLKRFIYDNADLDIPFRDVTQSTYREIMAESFDYTETPVSYRPTTKKRSAYFNAWLTNDSVSRSTIFLLGFGLGMDEQDVSDFLTKVLKEEDVDFLDYDESIYWYCFKKGLDYHTAMQMQEEYANAGTSNVVSESIWKEWMQSPKVFFTDEINLRKHLNFIQYHQLSGKREETIKQEYMCLYEQCRQVIADIYNATEQAEQSKKVWTKEEISPADFEAVFCAGIPKTKNGNLQKNASSKLSKQFQQKRMNRQRISNILQGKQKIQRFDLITLLFLIYAETVEKEWPAERFLRYVDHINEILKKCDMIGIYPVNPYESFVLMCLLSDEPLEVYSEIWEMSYK